MHTDNQIYPPAANLGRVERWIGRVAKRRRKIPTVLTGVFVATAIVAGPGPGSAQGTASSFNSANAFSGEYYDSRESLNSTSTVVGASRRQQSPTVPATTLAK